MELLALRMKDEDVIFEESKRSRKVQEQIKVSKRILKTAKGLSNEDKVEGY